MRHSGDGTSPSVTGLAGSMRAQGARDDFHGSLEGIAMFERDGAGKAHRGCDASSEIETGLAPVQDPREGARLVRAFLQIADPSVRQAIVRMVENVGGSGAGRTPPDLPLLHAAQ